MNKKQFNVKQMDTSKVLLCPRRFSSVFRGRKTLPIRILAKRLFHSFFKAWKIGAFMYWFHNARPVTHLKMEERDHPTDFAKHVLRRITCRVTGSSRNICRVQIFTKFTWIPFKNDGFICKTNTKMKINSSIKVAKKVHYTRIVRILHGKDRST
jgi:hypothetical protein